MTYYLIKETFGERCIFNKKDTLYNLKEMLANAREKCKEEETIQEIKEAISLVKNNKDIEDFYFGTYEITSVYADIVFATPNKRYFDKRRVYVLDNDVFITDMGGNVLDHFRRD